MSELNKAKEMASAIGIDLDALVEELKDDLLADSREAIGNAVQQIESLVKAGIAEIREGIPGQVEEMVRAELGPLKEAAEQMNQEMAKRIESLSATGSQDGTSRDALWVKGMEVLNNLIAHGDPVKQIQRMAELRNAMFAFEPSAPTPDTVFRIYADAAKRGMAQAGKGGSSPLGPDGRSGSAAPRRGRSRSLLEVVKEVG